MPWLGLLAKIAYSDLFISWDDVPREDSGFENRNRILGTGGAQWLTVPIHRSRDVKIKDILIANEHDWQRKHFRAIELGYSKAPHWKQYEPALRFLYETKWERLVDLNEQILTFLLSAFGITVSRVKLSSYGLTTTKAQLVLDACKKAGAWKYIFGKNGPAYLDASAFRKADVEVFVQDFECVPYRQVGSDAFVPGLFAFDALLNLGPEEAREIMLRGNTTVRHG